MRPLFLTMEGYNAARITGFLSALLALSLLFSAPAYAAETPMSYVICTVYNWLQGNLGRAVGTLGIISVGVAALLGKASWGMAITVACGIAILFSAGQLTLYLIGVRGC